MTFNDFKNYLPTLMYGDKGMPADADVLTFTRQALNQVVTVAKPTELITYNEEDEILLVIDSGKYIQAPQVPAANEHFKLNETLVYAVAHYTCSYFAGDKRKEILEKKASNLINDYTWNRHRLMESSDYEDEASFTNNSLNILGFKKIYVQKTRTMNGFAYEFDSGFIELLENFLMDKALYNLSKSDRNNIDLFLSFAHGTMDTTIEEFVDFTKFDDYLGGLI